MSKESPKEYIVRGVPAKVEKRLTLDEKIGLSPLFTIFCPMQSCEHIGLAMNNNKELYCPSCKTLYDKLFVIPKGNATPAPTADERPKDRPEDQSFPLIVCVQRVQQDWAGDFTGKRFSSIHSLWKEELESWYAVVPVGFHTDNVTGKKDDSGDAVAFMLSGIDGQYKTEFTGERLSRLTIQRVFDSIKDTAKIEWIQRVKYDFTSTVPGLTFKKP
jgi:hypothetical protein